eukprot:s2111_g7.t2
MAARSISNRIAGRWYADLRLRQRCRWQLAGIRCASTLTEVAPSEKENNAPRRLATPPKGFRRMTLRDFDIPIENKPAVDLAKQAEEDPDEDGPIRISEITGQEVQSLWPPTPLIDMKSRDKLMESLDQNELMEKVDEEERREVARPFLWLQHEEQDFVGNEDVGRFVKIARDDLLEHLPEGGCGELSRDLTLIPDRTRDVGLMDMQTWPVPDQLLPPELASEAEAWAPLYGNLYPQSPPSRRRSVQDGFATPEECRDACGFCIRAMYCMFRRGGQTSLAVGPSLERRMGAKGAELLGELVERSAGL